MAYHHAHERAYKKNTPKVTKDNAMLSVYFLIFCLLLPSAKSETLLERLAERVRHPKRNLVQDLTYSSDAISGPRSLHSVGTFAGRPIETRQRNVFIDNQGVPVPVEDG